MTDPNKFGLRRYVPADVAREVRQRCGFGCVIDGNALITYEHFDPPFVEAEKHCADGITLLCINCNTKKERGHLSVETIRAANANPRCKQTGFASNVFDISPNKLVVEFASVKIENCPILLMVAGVSILELRPPEAPGQPLRLSGRFSDNDGAVTLAIKDNVWSVEAVSWDIECDGSLTTVRRGPRDIVLAFRIVPPERLVIERFEMRCEGRWLRGDHKQLELFYNGKNWQGIGLGSVRNCKVGIAMR